uniref:Uncharacterized protein n=1 Tax=Rhizophora mucronata TaxID=61149 RepID=A0A2P2QA92_RHIMU
MKPIPFANNNYLSFEEFLSTKIFVNNCTTLRYYHGFSNVNRANSQRHKLEISLQTYVLKDFNGPYSLSTKHLYTATSKDKVKNLLRKLVAIATLIFTLQRHFSRIKVNPPPLAWKEKGTPSRRSGVHTFMF